MATSLLLGECYRGISELQDAMSRVDETGLRLTQALSTVLKGTVYKYVGDVLETRMCDVYTYAKSKASLDIVKEMDAMLVRLQDLERKHKLDPDTYQHTICHVALLLVKLKRQYYSLCSNRVADLVHTLPCVKGEEPAAGEITKLVFKVGLADGLESPIKSNASLPSSPWGSPKNRNKLSSSGKSSASSSPQHRPGFRLMSLFERKAHSEERSSFYVDVDDEKSGSGKNEIFSQDTISSTSTAVNVSSVVSTVTSSDSKTHFSSGQTSGNKDTSSENKGGNTSSISDQDQETNHTLSSSMAALSGWLPQSSSSASSLNNSANNNKIGGGDAASSTTPSSTADSEIVSQEPTSKLASEEDLESIINLLSGLGPPDATSPMQAIPEVPTSLPLPSSIHQQHQQHHQGGPIQLVVPQIYRLPSPASDTQVEELRSPSRQHQVHRYSEGSLDLSSMRPSLQQHQHHQYHNQQQQQQQQHNMAVPPPHPQYQHHHHHHPHPRFINTQQPPPPLGPNATTNLNLPWVQIQSASSHGSISTGSVSLSDCPSPLSGYTAGDSSPGYAMSPSPSFPSSPARLPVSAGSGGSLTPNSLNVGGGAGAGGSMSLSMPNMRGRSLSPFQQSTSSHHQLQQQQQQQWGGVGSGSSSSLVSGAMFGGGGGVGSPLSSGTATAPGAISGRGGGGSSPRLALTPELSQRKQGTWPPTYGQSTSNQMNLGWSGVHDSSDLSDDSSTEDQFFAVGTDLCHALDSKGDSSDEEGYSGHPGQAKNSSTWPLPNAPVGVPDVVCNRGLTPDLLEPPDLYHQHHQHQQAHHRPVQMQWSDPMSSRSEWPARSLDPSQRKTSQSMYGFGGMP